MILLDLDPNVVKPGWTPLIITVVLAGALVLLYLSMRRQFRKINVGVQRDAEELLASTAETPVDGKTDEPGAAPPAAGPNDSHSARSPGA